MKILYLNGPNLNMLGIRQPEIYGSTTLAEIEQTCRAEADILNVEIDFKQSNYEGELVDWIQQARGVYDGIILNAAAYTHTSVAILDSLNVAEIPVLELHLSNILEREEFRHHSYVEMVAFMAIMGEGAAGYPRALHEMVKHLSA